MSDQAWRQRRWGIGSAAAVVVTSVGVFVLVALLRPGAGGAQNEQLSGRTVRLPEGTSGAIALPDSFVLVGDGGLAELRELETAFQGVITKVAPSVVSIRTERVCRPQVGWSRAADAPEQLVVVNGSGAVWSAGGQILTNEHVVRDARAIRVTFADGRECGGRVIGADPQADLALVQVEREGLRPVRVGVMAAMRRGQWALVIGNPFGLGGDGQLSVSTGVIANLNRSLPGLDPDDDRLYTDMIQTTTPINPGNSGGPLFNLSGEMIGIVTAMHTRAGADEGVGFAIPLAPNRLTRIERLQARAPQQAKRAVELLTVDAASAAERTSATSSASSGAIAWRGLRLVDRRDLRNSDRKGVRVIAVAAESAGGRAQIRVGDLIDQVDDVGVGDVLAFRRLIQPKNGAVSVHIQNRGEVVVQP